MIISFSRISSGNSGQSSNYARENTYRYQKFFKKSLITWGIGRSSIPRHHPGFLDRVQATPREDWSTLKPAVLGLDRVQTSIARIPFRIPGIKVYRKNPKTELKESVPILKGSEISNFTSFEIFKTSSESLDSNKSKTLLTEIRDLSTNPSFLSKKSSLQKFNKNASLFSYAKHSSIVRKDQIYEREFPRTKLSENQFKFGNRKKIFDWVCYSQSQYPVKKESPCVLGLGEVQNSPARIDWIDKVKPYKPFENKKLLNENAKDVGVYTETQQPSVLGLGKVQNSPARIDEVKLGFDSFELVNINKTLFERQNILRCYKERNLLRLILAFFDFSTGSGSFSGIDVTKTLTTETFFQNFFKTLSKELKNQPPISFIKKRFIGSFALIRRKVLSLSPASFIVVQIFIIPYTFLFGIFYTCGFFQVSSTLTAKNFSNLSEVTKVTDYKTASQAAKTVQDTFLTKKIHLNGEFDSDFPEKKTFFHPFKQLENKSNKSFDDVKSTIDNLYSYSIQFHAIPYEVLRLSHFSSKLFILWGFLTIWKGVRPSKSSRNEYIIQTRLLTPGKNKKRFQDVEGVEKFFPIFKTLMEGFAGLTPVNMPYLALKKSISKKSALYGTESQSIFSGLTTSFFNRQEKLKKGEAPRFGLGSNLQIQMTHPKGYLFIGPPGTGKTLLAQAIAGEAKVNLICLSASEIQKQIDIGTRIGAIRLRNLFEQARKNTPCILFLDEIDAIGRARNESMDLKLFTEFLIQMDSFSVKDGFIVIGTTNFLSSLDSAFIRSGRFDRIIGLNYPGKQTRIAILKLYTQKGRNIFDKSISWNHFGEITKGLSAADLAKVVNESALYLIQSGRIPEGNPSSFRGFASESGSKASESQIFSGKIHRTPLEVPESSNSIGVVLPQEKATWLVKSSSRKKNLVHTAESLQRGIERISRQTFRIR